jgi:hypothetical protein
MARIELDQVTKLYPGGVPAVNDLSLDIPDGLAIARQAGGDRPSTIPDTTPHKPSPEASRGDGT